MKENSRNEAEIVHEADQITAEGLEPISGIFKGMVEPLADSQIQAARETTKQAEIIAKSTNKFFLGVFIIAGMVVILAAVALFQDKDQITEKVIIALFAFLGGFGAGKSIKRQ